MSHNPAFSGTSKFLSTAMIRQLADYSEFHMAKNNNN